MNDKRLNMAVICVQLIILVIGFCVSMYFLTDYPFSSHSISLPSQPLSPAQMTQLQAEITELQQRTYPPASDGNKSYEAFKAGLAQHEELLNQAREDLKRAEEDVKNAKEAEERIRGSAAIFLSVFGVLAALVLGQGYLQIKGLNERAQESIDKVNEVKADMLLQVEKVRPDLILIKETRDSLESELPNFLDEARKRLLFFEDPSGSIQQEDLALIDEIDHLTFLANAQIRFQKSRSAKEAKDYLLSLLVAGRGHIARRNYSEAFARLDEFFRLVPIYTEAASARDKAQGYSYRAFAAYQLLKGMTSNPSWLQQANSDKEERLRKRAFADIQQAKESDPEWDHTGLVEALLYSLQFVPSSGLDTVEKAALYLEGQKRAVEIYQSLISGKARQKQTLRRNYACCLKRIAEHTEKTEDYSKFKVELAQFPDDLTILKDTIADATQKSRSFLWQGMMTDSELFQSLKSINPQEYKEFWTNLLDEKVKMRSWRTDLQEVRKINPSTHSWQILL